VVAVILLLFIYCVCVIKLSVAQVMQCQLKGCLMNNKLGRMWEVAVLV
jgi:hypothetical protein